MRKFTDEEIAGLAAMERLDRDGDSSNKAMQRRVRAFAHEKKLAPTDIKKLMKKRPSDSAIMAFCKKHKVSFDWLLAGDLKGLRRMVGAKA
jgi:hypothetical protein